MEEIRFKPSIKQELFLLGFGAIIGIFVLILAVLIHYTILIGLILSFIIGLISIGGIFSKIFLTYTITNENEIIVKYSFLSQQLKIFRVDQITSISQFRSPFQKLTGLGSIKFGIFGKNVVAIQPQQSSGTYMLNSVFISIENYEEIFDRLSKVINLKTDIKEIYKEKPKTLPNVFGILLNFIFMISFSVVLFFVYNFLMRILRDSNNNFILNAHTLNIVTLSIFAIYILISLLILFAQFINYFILRQKVNYIYEDKIESSYNYFFSSAKTYVPIKKITNTQIKKNLISYMLFKVGSVTIFTGGSNDPTIKLLGNYEKFADIVSNLYSGKSPKEALEHKKEEGYKTTPSSSFFITYIFWSSIFFLPIIIGLLFIFYGFIGSIFFGVIYIFTNILRLILLKNTSYEFFDSKIVDKSGILNITTKEIYFKNIKHIELKRNLILDRILSQGTIFIYTPGSGTVDNKINSVKEYKQIYKELKEIIGDIN